MRQATTSPRRIVRRFTVVFAALAVAIGVAALPATSHPDQIHPEHALQHLRAGGGPGGSSHIDNPRSGLEEVGFHPLGNKGFNTDIMPWVAADGQVYAATGTWGTLTALGGDLLRECPSETDPAERDAPAPQPTEEGVWIINATDPANPVLASKIPTVNGAQNLDIKVETLPTTDGERQLLIHSLEPCGAEGILHQIPGSPFTDVLDELLALTSTSQTGFEIYDVTDAETPVRLGTWNNRGLGTHNLIPFSQGNRSFVAAVLNTVDTVGVEQAELVEGALQIVEITDPANPVLLAEWHLGDNGPSESALCETRGNDSALCLNHDVWVNDEGTIAYNDWWDAGLILLDISDPANPTFIGQGQGQLQDDDPQGWLNEEGNTHSSIPVTVDGRDLAVVGDEDFTGGGQIGVTVNSPGGLTGFHPATQWDGTAPVQGDPVHTEDLVYAGTGCTAAQYAPVITEISGKIALVDKRTDANGVNDCPSFTFKQKMDAAEAAGAIGLVQIDEDDAPSAGNAVESGIPGLEISNTAGIPLRDAILDDGETVNVTLGRGGEIDPWGFLRVVDVTDDDPANWREVAQFKAPHVEDPEPGAEDQFTAHNPILGPDDRVYVSWYTNGVRVLELSGGGSTVSEAAWFVPRPEDHPADNDSDPHGAMEDNVGFWGSWPLCHPSTDDLLVFNTDINRGIYILRAEYQDCEGLDDGDGDGDGDGPAKVTGVGRAPGSSPAGSISFGLNARSNAKGHVNVRDHGTGQHVTAHNITVVSTVPNGDGETVRVRGTCRIDGGAPQPCEVLAVDRGEPGTDDEIHIEVRDSGGSALYEAGGMLEQGNIKVHPAR